MGLIRRGVDILTTTVDRVTNKILAQTGNVVGEVAESDNVEWWQHVGFSSRPSNPTKGKTAAQALVMEEGGHDIAFASQDTRSQEIYGNLKPGETCFYAAGADGLGQARVIGKADGSINIYTTDTNTKDGKAVYFRVAPDGFSFVAPWGSVKFDSTGFHINHSSGASFNLGGIYGLPGPLSDIASYVRMQAGSLNVSASAQSMGVGPGKRSLAAVTEVMVANRAVLAAVQAVQTSLAAFAVPPLSASLTVPPAAIAAVGTALATAISTANTALTAAELAMATTTSST